MACHQFHKHGKRGWHVIFRKSEFRIYEEYCSLHGDDPTITGPFSLQKASEIVDFVRSRRLEQKSKPQVQFA